MTGREGKEDARKRRNDSVREQVQQVLMDIDQTERTGMPVARVRFVQLARQAGARLNLRLWKTNAQGMQEAGEYRLAVDMQDGDLLLMDAHAWHGNTEFDPVPKRKINGQLEGDPGFERVSVVSYFRARITDCGSASDEAELARTYAEQRNAALIGE